MHDSPGFLFKRSRIQFESVRAFALARHFHTASSFGRARKRTVFDFTEGFGM
jgi:hypothetical protein